MRCNERVKTIKYQSIPKLLLEYNNYALAQLNYDKTAKEFSKIKVADKKRS